MTGATDLASSGRRASLDAAEAEFLEAHPTFGETASVDELRASDYARLDAKGDVYLDYTGGSLYAESQLREHMRLMSVSARRWGVVRRPDAIPGRLQPARWFGALVAGYVKHMTEHAMDQGWISFDVHAQDSAVAARVAMALRERLPAATIKSAPDDLARQEVLHCDAAIPDRTAAETEQAVKAALGALPDVGGPDAMAEVSFARAASEFVAPGGNLTSGRHNSFTRAWHVPGEVSRAMSRRPRRLTLIELLLLYPQPIKGAQASVTAVLDPHARLGIFGGDGLNPRASGGTPQRPLCAPGMAPRSRSRERAPASGASHPPRSHLPGA